MKKIIGLRNKDKTVRKGELTSYSSEDICAFTKVVGSKTVLVLSNLRDRPVIYTMPSVLANKRWKDAFAGSERALGSSVDLAAYSYLVLKKNDL